MVKPPIVLFQSPGAGPELVVIHGHAESSFPHAIRMRDGREIGVIYSGSNNDLVAYLCELGYSIQPPQHGSI